MDDGAAKQSQPFSEIDFSMLMDLRVDYAFKLIFGSGDASFLISLLNAVFASKKIPRTIETLTVTNPYLEKRSKGDKLSILDLRAKLCDGAAVLIEMHLYGMDDLKYKTIRSWARAYGEELREGEDYKGQPPVICVTFADGSIDEGGGKKIHKCCKIMDIDEHTVVSDALELHYIDMRAFAKTVNEAGGIGKGVELDSVLAKWLALITEKEIEDKAIIRGICAEQGEIGMAVSELVRLSEDMIVRHAYQRRQDELMLQRRKDMLLAEKDAVIAEKDAALVEKDAALVERDAEIEQLRRQLSKLRPRTAKNE